MKLIIASVGIGVILVAGAMSLSSKSNGGKSSNISPVSNIAEVNGKQVVAITAKGGYFPGRTAAKANVPTIIKMETKGTFDCSSALVIPSLGYRKNLPPSGMTEIEIPPQSAGTTLQGSCSMGMYHFAVVFE